MAGCNPTLSASHRNHLGRDDCARSKRWFCLAIEFNLDSLRIDPSTPPGRSSPNDLHKKLSLLKLHRNVLWWHWVSWWASLIGSLAGRHNGWRRFLPPPPPIAYSTGIPRRVGLVSEWSHSVVSCLWPHTAVLMIAICKCHWLALSSTSWGGPGASLAAVSSLIGGPPHPPPTNWPK